MKLNYAQRKHLIEKLNQQMKTKMAESLSAAQILVLAAAKREMIAYKERHKKAEALMGKFEEELLFSEGGLEEANALIASFIKKF